jgi:ParB family chromosome partitioning protein
MSKQIPAKSRLGRGLSSLMNLTAPSDTSSVATEAVSTSSDAPRASDGQPSDGVVVREIPVESLSPNPHQPRRHFDETALTELANSLKTTGMIQPVVARATDAGGFELVAGERRWRAAKLAGLTTLPVIVKKLDPIMQAQMALVENLQRQDLNPIERANAYKTLLGNLGLTQGELADRLGEDRSVIAHHVRLVELPESVQRSIAEGRLSLGHAKVLLAVLSPTEQARLAELCVQQDLTIRNLERLISVPPPNAPETKKTLNPGSAHLADLEKNLSRHLGMRVQVKSSPGKKQGRIVLHYASLDQFDDLMNRLGVAMD